MKTVTQIVLAILIVVGVYLIVANIEVVIAILLAPFVLLAMGFEGLLKAICGQDRNDG